MLSVVLLGITLWLLLGALGAWIGWAGIDKREYDMEMLPFVVTCIFGVFTLMAVSFTYCVDHKIFARFSKIKVFKGKPNEQHL